MKNSYDIFHVFCFTSKVACFFLRNGSSTCDWDWDAKQNTLPVRSRGFWDGDVLSPREKLGKNVCKYIRIIVIIIITIIIITIIVIIIIIIIITTIYIYTH